MEVKITQHERGTMSHQVTRNLLKASIGRQIFCKRCETVLDIDMSSLCTVYDSDNTMILVQSFCHGCTSKIMTEAPEMDSTLILEVDFSPAT